MKNLGVVLCLTLALTLAWAGMSSAGLSPAPGPSVAPLSVGALEIPSRDGGIEATPVDAPVMLAGRNGNGGGGNGGGGNGGNGGGGNGGNGGGNGTCDGSGSGGLGTGSGSQYQYNYQYKHQNRTKNQNANMYNQAWGHSGEPNAHGGYGPGYQITK